MKTVSFLYLALCSCAFAKSTETFSRINDKYERLVGVANAYQEKNDQSLQTQCWKSEIDFENNYSKSVLALEKLFLKNSPELSGTISKNIRFKNFAQSKSSESQKLSSDIIISNRTPTQEQTGLKAFQKEFSAFTSSFKKIEKAEIDVTEFNNNKMAKGELIIKGINSAGLREQHNMQIALSFENEKSGVKINQFEIQQDNVITKLTKPLYAQASLLNAPTYQRLEAIRRGGYALAVGDYDGDGHQDLLVGAYGPMKLFKGDGKGNFAEDKNSGIPALTLVKSAVWADFNNDGLPDLMVVRFVDYTNKELSEQYKDKKYKLFEQHSFSDRQLFTAVSFYKNLGEGKFAFADEIQDSEMVEKAMPAVVADFNNDGRLDVYVGYPGVKDFTTFSNDAQKKIGKKIQGLFLNNGNFKFAEKSMSGPSNRLFEIFSRDNLLYPHSALAADINNSGFMDIVVVDDRGNLSPIYKNNGKGDFVENSQKLGIENHGIGMGVAAADLNNDGLLDLALSNIVFDVDHRFDSCSKTKSPQVGLRLFVAGKKSAAKNEVNFSEITDLAGIKNPGQGLGGVEFIDYDSDGRMDLYVTNGLWTGSDKGFDLTGVVKRAMDEKFEGVLLEEPTHTKSYVMDVLANYKNKKNQLASMGGFQSNRLYKNLGNNKFVDVSYIEGVDSQYDGYIIAKGDFNEDGIPDIILRNADPGTLSVKNPPVELFLSTNTGKNNLILKLTFKSGNRDAIGAKVKVLSQGVPTQTQTLIANNGSSQSEKNLYFSLGNNEQADQVEVTWPNGKVEVFKNLKKGRQNIIENHSTVAQH